MDGHGFETLGHNFRNNYEVAIDSFGTLWQSDNDDDGNRGVRINYVMEFGNYGYTDEMTGAGWSSPRTNIEAEIPAPPLACQNDPGVVPNLLLTGQRIADRHLRLRRELAAGGLPQPGDPHRRRAERGPGVPREGRRARVTRPRS